MFDGKLDYKPALDALRAVVNDVENTRPLMASIRGIMHRAVEDNFAAQGRPKWKDLHEGTKAARAKQGTWPGMILQRSGRLAASIVQESDHHKAQVGTNVIYARIQQLGGKTKPHVIRARNKRALSIGGIVVQSVNHPGSDIPARPFLTLEQEDREDIELEARDFYQAALGRHLNQV